MASITGFSFASSASVMERNLTRYTIIRGVAWFVTAFCWSGGSADDGASSSRSRVVVEVITVLTSARGGA